MTDSDSGYYSELTPPNTPPPSPPLTPPPSPPPGDEEDPPSPPPSPPPRRRIPPFVVWVDEDVEEPAEPGIVPLEEEEDPLDPEDNKENIPPP